MAYVNGGQSALPAASTVVGSLLSATGFDRLLLFHIGTVSANSVAFWKLGATISPYTTATPMTALDMRDFGPWYFGSSESCFGGGATSSGWLQIDELRV